MLNYDWENSVGHWICAASHVLRKTVDARLIPEGITIRQWEVLAWLSSRGCGSQVVLADQLGIEPHTLAGILNRMEKAGLLVRKPCTEDRRRNTLHPTEKAIELWDRATAVTHQIRYQATTGFTPEELQVFKAMCERLIQNLDNTISLNDESGYSVPIPCIEEAEETPISIETRD